MPVDPISTPAARIEKPRIYASAIICENAITEKGTNVVSAVRITNRFTQGPYTFIPHLPDGTLDEEHSHPFFPPFSVSLIFLFSSEQAVEFSVRIQVVSPTGKLMPLGPESIPCRIPEGGEIYSLKFRGRIDTEEAGLYWFEVYVDGELATKAPLNVTLVTDETEDSGPESEQGSDHGTENQT